MSDGDSTPRAKCFHCVLPPRPGRATCETCAAKSRVRDQRRCKAARDAVFAHYGRACACCGETGEKFLTIDHVNNDGAEQRKRDTSGIGGNVAYRWLVRKGFPEGFRTLCFNCNMARAFYGECPHARRRREDKK